MYDQTEDLKLLIKGAIRNYESRFTEKRPMSERRSLDVVDLRMILNRNFVDLEDCIYAVKHRLARIRTGWWIFQTGRSHLKSGVMAIIKSYEDPVMQHMLSRISGLTGSSRESTDRQSQDQEGVPMSVLSSSRPCFTSPPFRRVSEPEPSSSRFSFSEEENDSRKGFGAGK